MNNLATLRGQLDTQLRDLDHSVWGQTEKEQLLINSVARLYPRVSRHIVTTVPTVADTYTYTLDANVRNVHRVDVLNASSEMTHILPNGSWELWGSTGGTEALTLHVGRLFIQVNNTLRVHGYGRYDITTNPIDDSLVPLVLARARAEAYRRIGVDRIKFEQWLVANQTQNISVNELLQLINEAEREAEYLEHQSYTIKKPVPARV